jgi:tRNA threonylcarbamoyladenosine biosynthesis protein TsaE
MAPSIRLELFLPDAAATAKLGAALAARLTPGDTVLLEGPLGAGKSFLARAVIRALIGEDAEVPSPTFTLMQSYDTPVGELIHADLYRLSGPADLDEIGLTDAIGRVVTLIEWPDRMAGTAPTDSLRITLAPGDEDDARRVWIEGPARFGGLGG